MIVGDMSRVMFAAISIVVRNIQLSSLPVGSNGDLVCLSEQHTDKYSVTKINRTTSLILVPQPKTVYRAHLLSFTFSSAWVGSGALEDCCQWTQQ
jgi:hypothetical protein